jgi:hypothetical protein
MTKLSNSSCIGVVLAGLVIALIMPVSAAASCGGSGGRSHGHNGSGGNGGWIELPPMTPDESDQANAPPPPQRSFDEPPPDQPPPQADGFRFPTPEEASPLIDERNAIQADVESLQQMQQLIYNGKFVLEQDADGDFFPVAIESTVNAVALGAALEGSPSEDSGKLGRFMAAQAAAQQKLNEAIGALQAKVQDINNKLGYNRYRPLGR